ncbi:hypothetical protein ALO_17781 [Acetonema longum DSM 6540]|uniref:DUF2508 domain-containing protein n=1 Tax=Acetonema longum DSM 6540 TaxID=1009370 RepID=F7NN73_9FIRM|nr:hypothetical protein ALO_17781 [Acetonema longum DSM 6540]
MKTTWLGAVQDWFGRETPPVPRPRGDDELPHILEQARQEWLQAQAMYNYVSDNDLIDHVVYQMQAAEKRYIYLLKLARQRGITRSPFTER